MILLVPSPSDGEFNVVNSAAPPAEEVAVEADLGQPFSQLPWEKQRSVLANLLSSAGGPNVEFGEGTGSAASGLGTDLNNP